MAARDLVCLICQNLEINVNIDDLKTQFEEWNIVPWIVCLQFMLCK